MGSSASPHDVSHQRLAGKVAIITGGASGIGASTVHLFHNHGAKVVIADIQDNLGQAIAEKLGRNVSYVHCDVSIEEDISNLIDSTVAKFGKLDIMYNNAGILDRPLGSILDTSKSDVERLINVNLVGPFLGAKHATRVMIPQRQGCILFTASACTTIAGISTHSYVMTKYGILGLAKNLTAELGQYGIRVNCISPFVVNTPMIEAIDEVQVKQMEAGLSAVNHLKGQILRAEDVAQAALFMSSDDANYVSGLNLVVDGGFGVINPALMRLHMLAGKVAIITGGASGIGASTAKLFHENGAKVVIADVQDSLGQALAEKLGENASYIHCNVADEDEVRNLIDTTVAKYGKLDIMHNNAGIADLDFSILNSEKSYLDRMISVNLVGAFLGAKHAARVMKHRGQGCILFTASACVQIGGLSPHGYAMTKYEIVELSKNLATELGGYGIRVNCVSPYAVLTGIAKFNKAFVPLIEALMSGIGNLQGKVLKAEDIARAALFLASDGALSISGVNLVVDGGYSVVNPRMMGLMKINLSNAWFVFTVVFSLVLKFISRRCHSLMAEKLWTCKSKKL